MVDFYKSVAIVIGINGYGSGISALDTPQNDARQLAEILREEHDYQVDLILDPTKSELEFLLHETLPACIGPDDRLLFYFAGHGIALDADDGLEGYLIPGDAVRDDRETFLPMQLLNQALQQLRCRHLLTLLDCCFAATFRWAPTRHLTALPEVVHQGRFERFLADPAWQVITSAASDEEALDYLGRFPVGSRHTTDLNEQKHSPFASALFDALAGEADLIPRGEGDGVITATELYLYLRERMDRGIGERTTRRQTPGLWPLPKHHKGEYIFLVPEYGELDLPPDPPLNCQNNPYRGLKPFEEEHSQLFFGRSKLISKLQDQVDSKPLAVVLGASGTGKSSLVKAGLIPALGGSHRDRERNGIGDEGGAWFVLPPMRPGIAPTASLKTALSAAIPDLGGAVSLNELSTDLHAFAHVVGEWSIQHPGQRMLLVVDQLEELITQTRTEKAGGHFQQLLSEALKAHPEVLRVVITVRTDFEAQFNEGLLKEQWSDSRFIVTPMTQDELREVILKPAEVRVLYYESDQLVDDLINEVVQTPGGLPLLSFALSEMYIRYLESKRQDRTLTVEDYKALGGVTGALKGKAEAVYENLKQLSAAHVESLRRVMMRMIAIEGAELARRRVPSEELIFGEEEENRLVEYVIAQLVAARLVVEDNEEGKRFVVPGHDALVLGWDRLLNWKKEAQDVLPLQRRLTAVAQDWAEEKDSQKKEGLLYDQDNPQLVVFEEELFPEARRSGGLISVFHHAWQAFRLPNEGSRGDTWLNKVEKEFVLASLARRNRQARRSVVIFSGVFVVLIVALIFALVQADAANKAADLRATEVVVRTTAEADALAEANQRATAEANAIDQANIAITREAVARELAQNAQNLAIVSIGGLMMQSEDNESESFRWLLIAHEAIMSEGWTTHNIFEEGRSIVQSPLTQPIQQILKGHQLGVNTITFHPSGDLLASGSKDQTILLWNPADPSTQPQFLDTQENISALSFLPEGKILAYVGKNGAEGSIRHLQLDSVSWERSLVDGQGFCDLAMAIDPSGLGSAYIVAEQQYSGFQFSEETTFHVYLYKRNNNPLSEFSSFHELKVDGHCGNTAAVALSADFLALGFSTDGFGVFGVNSIELEKIWVWDLNNLNKEPQVLTHGDSLGIRSLSFDPSGHWLASGGYQEIYLWDLGDFESDPLVLGEQHNFSNALAPKQGHSGWVNSLAFDSSSRWLASGGEDSLIRLWDMDVITEESSSFNGALDIEKFPSFSGPWPFLIFEGHESAVNSLVFHPSGRWLASGSEDHTVRLWPVIFEIVAFSCEQAGRNFTWDEWQQYQEGPYEKTCDQYPVHCSVPEEEWPNEFLDELSICNQD